MKWFDLPGLRLAAVGVVLIAACASAQLPGTGSSGDGGAEPSRCLTDAVIHVTANPTSVTLGQSSVVSWSVSLSERCPGVHVRFNGQAVAASGSQSVTPARTSSFTVLVSETHLGVFGQTSKSVQIAVSYPPRVDRKSTHLNSSHPRLSRMPSSA